MAKTRSRQEAQEQAFNRRYSRFKIVFYFKDGNRFTHYGHERVNCTVEQINFGHVKTIVLDRAKGLSDCLVRLEWFAGKYQTAMLFDRRGKTFLPDGTEQKGVCVRKFIKGVLVESSDLDLADPQIHLQVKHKGDTWTLEPIPSPTGFKQMVNKKLDL
ncbi:MAG TPA: hypothetical protein PKE07_05000 [Lacibacter sp.]|nr:hypothetical protein [Lacibacter sp.]HMO89548.1 hypothetical protein [Lacibacter sp.]